jgi:uncharacterized protein (DUF849 family)
MEDKQPMKKLIINVAVTGIVPTKKDNPALPITPDEIAEDCLKCYRQGATLFHLHARDERGNATFRSDIYREIIFKTRQKIPDAILCVSTSGRVFNQFEQRSEVLNLDGFEKPDMASLTLGSMNFPTGVSVNEPSMIHRLVDKMKERGITPELEIFDLGMIDYAKRLIEKKILKEPFYFNLILGSIGMLSATPFNLSVMLQSLPQNAIWAGGGIGKNQFFVNAMAVVIGGHVRIGLEDCLYMDNDKREFATNEKLTARIVALSKAYEREICNAAEARALLGLV